VIARGSVHAVRGGWVQARMPGSASGAGVRVGRTAGRIRALEDGTAWIALHGAPDGIVAGTPVYEDPGAHVLALGTCALGRAIGADGAPLDGGPALRGARVRVDVDRELARAPIAEPMWTGVRAVDALLTIGRGARIGIFGAPGAGKSTLLETIVQGARADAAVVGLVGERGREAQTWIAGCTSRQTVICATSDAPAALRVRAAQVTMAHARALASRGLHVLVLLDSLARTAAALRELAVAAGESAGRGGYPPSVFADVAHLVERAGAFERGSVTLVATVLSDGDDRDPVSDAARSLLDGHLQLSPRLAGAGRFPAIDVPASASRTMNAVIGAQQATRAASVRRVIALLERSEDARALGIDPQDAPTRAALAAEPAIERLLRQGPEPSAAPQTLAALAEIADMLEVDP
jgi:FliI/YscN family ATPase